MIEYILGTILVLFGITTIILLWVAIILLIKDGMPEVYDWIARRFSDRSKDN